VAASSEVAAEVVCPDLSFAIQLFAECELVLLRGSELQPRLGRRFKSVDAQLHKTPDCGLSQVGWAGT
jgi:hypothetical protein